MICTRILGFNIQSCRQAAILAGRYRFCLKDSESKILSSHIVNRHLYQTVKKRALETRAKLKKNEYIINRPCPDDCDRDQDTPTKKPKSKCAKGKLPDDKGGKPPPPSSNLKWILAGLALAGLGTVAFLLLKAGGGDDHPKKEKEEDEPQVPVLSKRVPASSKDLPKKVPYLLIGGGTASFSAFRAIKANDPKAKVLVISNEFLKPYMRPPLSKELWYASEPGVVPKSYRFKQWTGAERSLFFEPEEFFMDPTKLTSFENGGIAVAQGYSVKKIDAQNRVATLTDGTEIEYEKCLLATGCSPKNLPVFANAPKHVQDKIMFFRSPSDFEKLKQYVDENKSITVIGNGFLGSELCCSLGSYSKNSDVKINQVYSESGNMSKVLPEYLSKWTTKKVEEQGVCVISGVQVKEVSREGCGLKLALSNGQTILTDIAVVCVGCEANTDIALLSGLEIDSDLGGFVVNAELEARQDLFVAGDASCFYDPLLGRRRLEHHDHSVISGRLAGENMVAKDAIKKPYEHQSMFWSDLGPSIGYEGIGRTDSSLPTVGVFALPTEVVRNTNNLEPEITQSSKTTDVPKSDAPVETKTETSAPVATKTETIVKVDEPSTPKVDEDEEANVDYGRGVIFYLNNDKIVGILLWNIFNRIGLARTIVNQNKSYEDLNEVAKLFEIHS